MTALPAPGRPEHGTRSSVPAPTSSSPSPTANRSPSSTRSRRRQAGELDGVRVHQMHALHDRPYLDGRYGDRLRHVRYFLSSLTRRHFDDGGIELVPPLQRSAHAAAPAPDLVVLAACSRPDRHGYVSLGTNADYVAAFVGRVPFFVEANAAHAEDVRPERHPSVPGGRLVRGRPAARRGGAVGTGRRRPPHRRFVAERIADGACIQAGIGSIPDAVLGSLHGHRELGIHTELLSDGAIDLVELGVATGVRKVRRPGKVVTTFALGTNRLYEFLDGNPAVELLPVDWVNDPRVIAQEPGFVSINATTEVDFLGRRRRDDRRSLLVRLGWAGDFAAAPCTGRGQGFLVLRSTAARERSAGSCRASVRAQR